MKKPLLFAVVMLLGIQTILAQDYAIEYNGTDQRIKYTDDTNLDQLDGATDYTIEVWVKPLSTDIHNNVVLKRWYQFALTLYQDDNKRVYFTHYGAPYDDGSGSMTQDATYINTVNNVITIGEWNHIAVINNSTDNELKIYVNGIDVTLQHYDAMALIANPDDASTYDPNMYIANGGSETNLNAQIDDVRILKVAEDISNLQTTAPNGTEYTTDANTVVLMKFNEGSGATTADDANGSATIDLENSPTWIDLSSLPVEKADASSLNLYPNPVVNTANIDFSDFANPQYLTVTDITGRIVYSVELKAGQKSEIINTERLTSGFYNVSVFSQDKVATLKMSVVK